MGEREKLACKAVSTKVSANLLGSFEAGVTSFYIHVARSLDAPERGCDLDEASHYPEGLPREV